MSIKKKPLFSLFLGALCALFPAGSGLLGQQIIDSCFTTINVGTSFAGNFNISNRNADCVNWTGTTWVGDWPGANLTLAPPGSVANTRGIWMGDGSVWTTGGEGFGLRLNGPLVNGITYNFEFTRVSHGTGSAGNFAPLLYTNTGGILGTLVGAVPGVGSAWTTGIISLTANAGNNGHTMIYFNAQSGGAGSGMFLACGNAVILPMEVRRLDGWAEPDANQLLWEMYNETGYTAHQVERSSDGLSFATIGELPSSGSEESTVYTYRDADAAALNQVGTFYRVRSLLADGAEAFTPVVEIHRGQKSEYLHKLWPNPVASGQALHLEYVSENDQAGILRLTDALGRTVASRELGLDTGLSRLDWELPALATGVYLLNLRTPRGDTWRRIVVE